MSKAETFSDHYLEFNTPLGTYLASHNLDGATFHNGKPYLPFAPLGNEWSHQIQIANPFQTQLSSTYLATDKVLLTNKLKIRNNLGIPLNATITIPLPTAATDISAPSYTLSQNQLLLHTNLEKEEEIIEFSYTINDNRLFAYELLQKEKLSGSLPAAAESLYDSGNYDETIALLLNSEPTPFTSSTSTLQESAQKKLEEFRAVNKLLNNSLQSQLKNLEAKYEQNQFQQVLAAHYDDLPLRLYLSRKQRELDTYLSNLQAATLSLSHLGIDNQTFHSNTKTISGLYTDFYILKENHQYTDLATTLGDLESLKAENKEIASSLAHHLTQALSIQARLESLQDMNSTLKKYDEALSLHTYSEIEEWANGKGIEANYQSLRQELLTAAEREKTELSSLETKDPLSQLILLAQLKDSQFTSLLSSLESMRIGSKLSATKSLESAHTSLKSNKISGKASSIVTEADRSFSTGRYLDAYAYSEYASEKYTRTSSTLLPAALSISTLIAITLLLNKSKLRPKKSQIQKIEQRLLLRKRKD